MKVSSYGTEKQVYCAPCDRDTVHYAYIIRQDGAETVQYTCLTCKTKTMMTK